MPARRRRGRGRRRPTRPGHRGGAAGRRARAYFEESLPYFRAQGEPKNIAPLLNNLAMLALRGGEIPRARALLEESVAIRRALNLPSGLALSLQNLGELTRQQGDTGAARPLLAEALTLMHQVGDRANLANALESHAALASDEKRHAHAARLFGAADAMRQAIGVPLPPANRHEVDVPFAAARAALGETAFAAAGKAGRTLSLEEAVAFALGEIDPAA